MHPISYTYEGTTYEAEYDFVDDNNIVVYLPDGPKETQLNGLRPYSAAMHHLKTYVHVQSRKSG